MSGATLSTSPHSTCPRCGYDLRGVIATWADACPLTGICSECGLELEWARVILPDKFVPTKCVEYAPFKMKAWIRACIWTALRVLLPWLLWRRVKMWHPPRLRRILAFLAVLFFVLLVPTYLYVQVPTAVVVRMMTERNLSATRRYWQNSIVQYQQMRQRVMNGAYDGVNIFNVDIPKDATAEDRERAIDAIDGMIAQFRAEIARGADVDASYRLVIAEAVFMPFARSSTGVINYGSVVRPYPAPIDVHERFRSGRGTWTTLYRVFQSDNLEAFVVAFAAMLALAFVFPCTLLLLVQTRKRSKLRNIHLVRISLYGLSGLIALPLLLVAAVHTCGLLGMDGFGVRAERWVLALLTSFLIFTFLWWWLALWKYARIPHSIFVAFLHLVLAFLLSGFVGAVLATGFSFRFGI